MNNPKTLKKTIAFVISIIMIIQFMQIGNFALAIENSTSYDPYYGWTPIKTKKDLNSIRDNLTNKYYLENDIIFAPEDFIEGGSFYNDGMGWIPIGSMENKFMGKIDGRNYKISGLTSTLTKSVLQYSGLVAVNGGELKRLVLDNIKIVTNKIGNSSDGYIQQGGLVSINSGIIKNCTVNGVMNVFFAAPFGWVSYAGGISAKNSGVILSCCNDINITVNGSTENLTVISIDGGGIVGQNTGQIRDCINNGEFSKEIVAQHGTTNYDSIGGLAGSNFGTIERCIDAANGAKGINAVGLCSYNSSFIINCLYIDSYTNKGNGNGSVFDAKKCTAAEMKLKSTYSNFDFSYIWDISEAVSFPFLRNDLRDTNDDNKSFEGGNGTEALPFLIKDQNQFKNISGFLNAHFKLVNDIVITEADYLVSGIFYNYGKCWVPLDDMNVNGFTGELDGNHFAIIGLKIPDLDYLNMRSGIFINNHGTIKNLKLQDVYYCFKGKLQGYSHSISGIVGNNYGAIANCEVFGSIIIDTSYSDYNETAFAGGICSINYGTIEYSKNHCNIKVISKYEFKNVFCGGIAATNYGDISKCSNDGNILASQLYGSFSGGISGRNMNLITECYNTGNISAFSYGNINNSAYSCSGGIAGNNEYVGNGTMSHVPLVENCFNIGAILSVSVNKITLYFKSIAIAGGITGNNTNGKINNCYNTGSVDGFAQGNIPEQIVVGAIAGFSNGGITGAVYSDYFDKGVGEGEGTDDCLSKSVEEMFSLNNYHNFDFNNIWIMDNSDNYKYPKLRNNALSYIKEPVAIVIEKNPSKLDYVDDEIFDFSDIIVKKYYNSGDSEYTKDFQLFSEELMYGENKIYVYHKDGDYEFEVYFNINITRKIPLAPTNFVSTSKTDKTVNLSWTPVEGATSYDVYSGTTKLNSTPITKNAYVANGLKWNTTYSFTVKAVNVDVVSPASATLKVTTCALMPPTGLIAVSASYNSVKLNWSAVVKPGYSVYYTVYRYNTVSQKYEYLKSVSSTSFTDTSLATGTKYIYKIYAYIMVNGSKITSSMTGYVSAVPTLGMPSSFTAVRYSATSIKLSWSAVAGASGYTIYRYNATTKVYIALTNTASLSYLNSGLTKNTTYSYKVAAYHFEGSRKVYGSLTAVKSAKPY